MSNGWYIESLLRNREKIRSSVVTKEFVKFHTNSRELRDDPEILSDMDFDDENFGVLAETFEYGDEDYNNLLLVEKKLVELMENKQLSIEEANVVTGILQHKPLRRIGKELNIQSRFTIINIFRRVCSRLEFLLGDGFTDEGYLAYLAQKYGLDEEQIQRGRDYMDSNKRFYIIRQTHKGKNE